MKHQYMITAITALVFNIVSGSEEVQDAPLIKYPMRARLHSIGQLCRASHLVITGTVKIKSDVIVLENCKNLAGLPVDKQVEFDSVLVTKEKRWDIDLYPEVTKGDLLLVFGFSKPIMGSVDLENMLWSFSPVLVKQQEELVQNKIYPVSPAGVIKLNISNYEAQADVVKKYWDHLHNPNFDRSSYQEFLVRGVSSEDLFIQKCSDIDLQNLIIGSDAANLREMASGSLLPEPFRGFAGQILRHKLNPPRPPQRIPIEVTPPPGTQGSG